MSRQHHGSIALPLMQVEDGKKKALSANKKTITVSLLKILLNCTGDRAAPERETQVDLSIFSQKGCYATDSQVKAATEVWLIGSVYQFSKPQESIGMSKSATLLSSRTVGFP